MKTLDEFITTMSRPVSIQSLKKLGDVLVNKLDYDAVKDGVVARSMDKLNPSLYYYGYSISGKIPWNELEKHFDALVGYHASVKSDLISRWNRAIQDNIIREDIRKSTSVAFQLLEYLTDVDCLHVKFLLCDGLFPITKRPEERKKVSLAGIWGTIKEDVDNSNNADEPSIAATNAGKEEVKTGLLIKGLGGGKHAIEIKQDPGHNDLVRNENELAQDADISTLQESMVAEIPMKYDMLEPEEFINCALGHEIRSYEGAIPFDNFWVRKYTGKKKPGSVISITVDVELSARM